MRIDVTVDSAELILRMRNGQRRLAYATVNAINRTTTRIQQAARDHVQRTFELRKHDFMLRQAAVIKPFASVKQSRPYAEIGPGKPPRLLLSRFERGGERPPFVGRRVAVPITGSAARRSKSSPVDPLYKITALRMRPMLKKAEKAERRSVRGATTKDTRYLRAVYDRSVGRSRVWVGAQRTYMVPGFGIFRRTGRGRRDTELLYYFDSDVRVQPVLEFLNTAKVIANIWFGEEMQREVVQAVAHNAARRS